MTNREKLMLLVGISRLELDIQQQQKSLELTTEERLRASAENIIESCRFTQKKIHEILGGENE